MSDTVKHACGAQGFGRDPSDRCPACESEWHSRRWWKAEPAFDASGEPIQRQLAAADIPASRLQAPRILSVKEVVDFPTSTLSATALIASHELLRAENAGLRRDIEALLAHPVIAARRIRSARRSVSEGARDE